MRHFDKLNANGDLFVSQTQRLNATERAKKTHLKRCVEKVVRSGPGHFGGAVSMKLARRASLSLSLARLA